jgi:hypothetical protein
MQFDTPYGRSFAVIDMVKGRIPDEATILAFMELREKHKLGR